MLYNISEVSNILNIKTKSVWSTYKRSGIIPIRKGKNVYYTEEMIDKIKKSSRLYIPDINIDNVLSWILGFILTDGYLHKSGSIQFHMAMRDGIELYEKFKQKIGFNGSYYIRKKTKSILFSFSKKLLGKQIIQVLPENGPKTFSVRLPYLPSLLVSHLLRGIFDGDGYFSIEKGKYNKYVRVGVCGNNILLSDVNKYLKENCDIKYQNITKCGKANCFRIRWGKNDSEKIIEFLYKDSDDSCRLSRKYEKAFSLKEDKKIVA